MGLFLLVWLHSFCTRADKTHGAESSVHLYSLRALEKKTIFPPFQTKCHSFVWICTTSVLFSK
jgi:hypothetical protein